MHKHIFCFFFLSWVFCTTSWSACRPVRQNADLPSWAVPYGGEFWSQRNEPDTPVDFGKAIERVSMAFQKNKGEEWKVRQSDFSIGFTDNTIRFVAHGSVDRQQASAEARLRTDAIRAGNRVLFSDHPGEWLIIGNTAQAPLDQKGLLLQHVEALQEGLEWVWVFNQCPATEDVEIDVQVDGLTYAGVTAFGHHFMDPSGHSRLRFGRAEAVDTAGHRWPIAVTRRGDRLCMTVPASILRAATYPLSVDPVVSAEFDMDQTVRSTLATGDEYNPRAAWGTTNYLVVWEDERAGKWSDFQADIYGVRMSAAGQILDPTGLEICFYDLPQRAPDVVWASNNFLVVWEDGRNTTNYIIYGARVTSGGENLDGDGFPIGLSSTNRHQLDSRIAKGTDRFLVVWEDYRKGLDIYGRLLNAAGVPLGTSDFAICTFTNHQYDPYVAWGGTNFLVAWEDHRYDSGLWNYSEIFGTRISRDGVILDSNNLAIGNYPHIYQTDPQVAWGVSNFLVVWADSRNITLSNRYDIYGTRVAGNGRILDSSLALCTMPSNQSRPSLAWCGTNYGMTWIDYRHVHSDVYGGRVLETGQLIDPNGILVSTSYYSQSRPSFTWNGTQGLAAWSVFDDDLNEDKIVATRLTENLTALDPNGIKLGYGASEQVVPDVAWGVSNYLVVWRDNFEGTNSDIRGLRIGSAGAVLDPYGIDICAVPGKQRDPAVAGGTNGFFVVWSDDRNLGLSIYQEADIYGARVSSGGTVLDPAGIAICTNPAPQTEPDIASDRAGRYLAVWQDYLTPAGPPYYSDIAGSRLNDAGTVLDPGYDLIPVSLGTNYQVTPAVAAGPTNYLVVWSDRRSNGIYRIHGARVDNAKNVLDPQSLSIDAGPTNQLYPSVCWGGTNYLVAWQDYRSDDGDYAVIRGARVNTSGLVLDAPSLAISASSNDHNNVEVGWSGTNYLAVWADARTQPNNLFGMRIDSAGRLLDAPDGYEMLPRHRRRITPVLAPQSNGVFLLVYTGFRPSPFNAMRIISALVDISPPSIQIASMAGQCDPATGIVFAVRGMPFTGRVTNAVVTLDRTQYVCRGWIGTGDVPSPGSSTNTGSFILANDSTLTWLWSTNYYLDAGIIGRGQVDYTNGWIAYASNKTMLASPGSHAYFGGWRQDVPMGDTNQNPLTLTMSQPRSVTVAFEPYRTPNGVDHGWLADHQLPTNEAATLLDQDVDGLNTREEYVANTDPTNAASYFAEVSDSGADPVRCFTLTHTWTDRVYGVLAKTGSIQSTAAWQPMGDTQPGTGGALTFDITNNPPLASYRFTVNYP